MCPLLLVFNPYYYHPLVCPWYCVICYNYIHRERGGGEGAREGGRREGGRREGGREGGREAYYKYACIYIVHVHDNSLIKRQDITATQQRDKATQHNTTQLSQSSHFSKKNWLPRVGFKPSTNNLRCLERAKQHSRRATHM